MLQGHRDPSIPSTSAYWVESELLSYVSRAEYHLTAKGGFALAQVAGAGTGRAAGSEFSSCCHRGDVRHTDSHGHGFVTILPFLSGIN